MTLLPTPEEQIAKDTEQLKILSIFWYIIAAVQALIGCGAFFPIGIGVLAFLTGKSSGAVEDAAAGGIFGGFFACIGLVILVIWWGLSFLNFMAARSLPKRKNRTLCMAMAVLECLIFPIGTVLGVITLMVLSRPTVKNYSA